MILVSAASTGKELPLYDVKWMGKRSSWPCLNVGEGLGDFVDPQNPPKFTTQVTDEICRTDLAGRVALAQLSSTPCHAPPGLAWASISGPISATA